MEYSQEKLEAMSFSDLSALLEFVPVLWLSKEEERRMKDIISTEMYRRVKGIFILE